MLHVYHLCSSVASLAQAGVNQRLELGAGGRQLRAQGSGAAHAGDHAPVAGAARSLGGQEAAARRARAVHLARGQEAEEAEEREEAEAPQEAEEDPGGAAG